MAKQTFTTGQVLTAAQMSSLQQTAMGGGEATAKTASYVLVSSDAGTTVIMNSGSATTITVNTALFAAGDTVNIQNIGAGVCTITNGSATVSTAGSLALSQWEGGVLYFRSASTATFFDYVQTGAVSPLTTKGDVWGYSTLDARIPVGTNNQVLTADSAQALGLKWATPTGSNDTFALLNSGGTALTGATTVTYTLGATYNQLFIFIAGASSVSASSQIRVRINGDTSTYYEFGQTITQSAAYSADFLGSFNALTSTGILLGTLSTDADSTLSGYVAISSAGTTGSKVYLGGAGVTRATGNDNKAYIVGGVAPTASAISTVSVVSSTGNLDAGTLYVYGG